MTINNDSPQGEREVSPTEEDRYYDFLASGGNSRHSLVVPKGNISDKTLEKLGVYACRGYRVGQGCDAKSYLCPDRAILWRDYGRVKYGNDSMASDRRCNGCKKKHDFRTGCDIWCSCGNV